MKLMKLISVRCSGFPDRDGIAPLHGDGKALNGDGKALNEVLLLLLPLLLLLLF